VIQPEVDRPWRSANAATRFQPIQEWIGDAAVRPVEVLKKAWLFPRTIRQTLTEILDTKPDAVVLIDYPGFNLRLALRKNDRRGKNNHYISPQGAGGTAGEAKGWRALSPVLCIFPFEADLYNQSGLRAVFVGHPGWKDCRREINTNAIRI
jgi:lipid-A-disaccharide synthase